jgi:hypothetical protein
MAFWRCAGNDRCLSGLWVHGRYMVMRREYIFSMQTKGIGEVSAYLRIRVLHKSSDAQARIITHLPLISKVPLRT